MTGYKKIFVDTAPFIYYLEQNPTFFENAKDFFMTCHHKNIPIVTSVITIEEYLVYPYVSNDKKLVDNFNQFLKTLEVELVVIERPTAEKAAMLRAEFNGIKGMDALQLASAILCGCDLFLTNDRQLKKVQEIKGVLIEEWDNKKGDFFCES
jgi:predicted nucleic acid-binding protein